MYFAQKSKLWPITKGTILDAKVKTIDKIDEDSGEYQTHEPHVHYAYRVDGVLYESRRLFFGSQLTSNYFEAADSLLGIHKNKRVTVYFDPRNPKRSVLHTGAGHVNPVILIAYVSIFTLSFFI